MKKYLMDFTKSIYSLQLSVEDWLNEAKTEPHQYKFKLFHSIKDSGWTTQCRGKLAATLENTGNGVSLTFGKKKLSLDYSELVEIQLLLAEMNKLESPLNKFSYTTLGTCGKKE